MDSSNYSYNVLYSDQIVKQTNGLIFKFLVFFREKVYAFFYEISHKKHKSKLNHIYL